MYTNYFFFSVFITLLHLLNAFFVYFWIFKTGTEPEVVEHQKLSAAGYTYSASAPPFVCQAATTALQKLLADPSMPLQVRNNSKYLYDGLNVQSSVLEITSDSCSPICILKLKDHVVESIGDEFEENQNQRENMERAALQAIVNMLITDYGIFLVASKYNLHYLYIESKKNKNSKTGASFKNWKSFWEI